MVLKKQDQDNDSKSWTDQSARLYNPILSFL